jgi:uncharacterized ion transporter superfamily protein YfcC
MKRKFPEAITIIMIIMIVFIVLTWIIPAGEFQFELINGRNYLIPGSFSFTEPSPQGLAAFLMAPVKGFVQAGLIIGFCFLVGGSFGILNKTGAIDAGLMAMLRKTAGKQGSKRMVIVLLMLIFSVCGATFGMSESVLVFIMLTIPMARAMGYDSITGLSVSFLAAGVGFAGALTNPFTIGIAQGIAGLPIFSGWEYRLLVWFVFTAAAIAFVLIYIHRIEKDPSKSPVYDLDAEVKETAGRQEEIPFDVSRKMVVILLFAVLALIIYGSNRWKWYINEISAVFLALGIVSAIVARLKTSEAVKSFVSGAKDMVMAALVIGLARGLLVIAEDGRIIGTMLFYIAQYANRFHTVMAVEMMFVFQGFLNFFVPSGSGQAALSMPVMAPLSDLVGISRQTAVLCFQFGDGIFNMIIPTSGVTMGALSIAGVPYNKWAKWLAPLILILTLLAMLLLIPPVILFNY